MVRAFSHQPSMQKSRSFHFKRMFELPGRQAHSLILESGHNNQGSRTAGESTSDYRPIGWSLNINTDKVSSLAENIKIKPRPLSRPTSDTEMMKEKFAKLLLGEDMSGGGKGASSALALSNAITNLSASVFAEKKLEPMPAEKKGKWIKEMEWLLSVTDHIVEFVPSEQQSKDGTFMEIMVTQQRNDLLMNIPALRKLDAMLIDCLDHFGNEKEFWYEESDGDNEQKDGNKWWIPEVKVPPTGLSEVARKWLQFQKDCVKQVLKATMAINAQVLAEMEIPESYIESLPKNGKASLGDTVYKSITDDYFNPYQLLSSLDLSTEHKVLDLKNRVEASIVIWKRKIHHKDGKHSWSSSVSLEKRELFEERAETILLLLKQKFPGISQSALDISKIQYNKDVGYSILESYSRIIESLAFNIISRIEDVLHADSLIDRSPSAENFTSKVFMESSPKANAMGDDNSKLNITETKTLSDFMGWKLHKGDADVKNISTGNFTEQCFKEENEMYMSKPGSNLTVKKLSYLEKLENLSGLRSPISRH